MAGFIRSACNAYVLDASGPNGGVVLNPQSASATTQQWAFDSTGCIVNEATQSVLAVGAGNAVVVAPRTSPDDSAQQWDFDADNSIANRLTGLVLTAGGLPAGVGVTVAQRGRRFPPLPIDITQEWALASASATVVPWFGRAERYDSGQDPAVALNSSAVVEVHSNQGYLDLYCRVGVRVKGTVHWSDSTHYDSGRRPDVDVDNAGHVIEVHQAPIKDGLWCRAGTLAGGFVNWGDSYKYAGSGDRPSVALNESGFVIEVDEANDAVAYRVSQVGASPPISGVGYRLASGGNPSVALNNHGVVVVAYEAPSGGTISYAIGTLTRLSPSIDWSTSTTDITGSRPSVTVTDGGIVVLLYESDGDLFQRQGVIAGNAITWTSDPVAFDTGSLPRVASHGDVAVHVHASSDTYGLWFTTSLITDRANWMRDRLPALGGRTLGALTIPAAHDAATVGMTVYAEAQDLTIGQQLAFGVRWFDLRPQWSDGQFVIHHGIVTGMPLQDVLTDIAQFLSTTANELAVFKFSHFEDFDTTSYLALFATVQHSLGDWLFTTPPPTGSRLADFTLSQFVAHGPCALAVFDTVDYPLPSGLWSYRDWSEPDAADGDLTVFDVYADSEVYSTMKADQEAKYAAFTGWCDPATDVPCDLFLFSWTMTPILLPVSWMADECDPSLGTELAGLPSRNSYGKAMNMVYVDYVERARVTDVAIWQNGLLG